MDTLLTTVAVVFIPLGFTVLIVGIQVGGHLGENPIKALAACIAGSGLLCLCLAVYFVRQKEKEQIASRDLLGEQLKAIFDELKGLRDDLKGSEDTNGGSDNNPR